MTLVIDESEEISSDLLVPLLATVKKENEVILLTLHMLHLNFLMKLVSYLSLITVSDCFAH